MNSIHFDSNQSTLLSEEVRLTMNEANLLLEKHRPISYGKDQKILAEIENARNIIADSLKLNTNEVFFSHGNINSFVEIINHAILFLKTEIVFTSVFESTFKLNYLKSLNFAGLIELKFIDTSELGEIDMFKLKAKLSESKSKSLLSLSHSNLYTGILLPLKEICLLCQKNQSYFHLDISLTIGKFSTEFSNIKPDFINFDSSLFNGPTDIGIKTINQNININRQNYRNLTNISETTENKNPAFIVGFIKAYSIATSKIDENKSTISSLRQYLIEKANLLLELKPYNNSNKKIGLYNLIPYYFDKKIFGEYLIEKLDMNGILVKNLRYPILNQYNNHIFITIALHEKNTESDIDYFIETLVSIKNKNKS